MNTIKAVDNQIEQFKTNRYDNIENALMYIEKAIKICKENNLEDKLQECRYLYASGQFDKGNWKESLSINMNIKKIIEERGEKYVTKIENFLTLGICNLNTGNYEISLGYYLEALENEQKKNDLDNIAKIKTNISEIYKKLKDYTTAKEYLDEALVYEKNLSDQILGVIYTNYAEVLTQMGRFSRGMNLLDKSDTISQKVNDNIGRAYNAMIRGRIYKNQKKYNKAEESFLQSLSIFKKAKDGVYIFEAYADYIEFLIKRNKLEKAEITIKEAFEIVYGKDSLITEFTLERHLASINYKRGNYKQAVDHFIAYDRIYDEYDKNVLKMRLLALETKFDILKSQREKKKIEKDNKELEEKHDILKNISNTDNLSGLYNRHYLNKIMDEIFYKKEFEVENISLIMLDIDFFKEYNDTYGHIEGDKVIEKIGQKIKDICCKYNIDAFRYGGDEFLITDYNLNKADLKKIGEKINTEIEGLKIRNLKSPISEYITVSVGITQVELERSCNQNKLIKKVDDALYESKRVGRNRVIFI